MRLVKVASWPPPKDEVLATPDQNQTVAMPRILIIEKAGRTSAILQSRLAAIAKIKANSCLEAALHTLADRKFELIIWNSASDPAAQANLSLAIEKLCAASIGAKTIVLTSTEELICRQPPAGHLYIQKPPINDEELVSLIEECVAFGEIPGRAQPIGGGRAVPVEFEGMIAVDLAMRSVIRRIMDAAAVDIPVVITGETGTGKDLVAAAIHRQSSRRDKAYVAVNLGAMAPELIASEVFGHERGAFTGAQEARAGIFEQANGGTVFLDEIATMDEKTQISLLRVLEEKTFRRVGGVKNIGVDARIIAATNEDLETKVAEKRFREDLFYRLDVFPIRLPPLRERVGAVTLLTDHFVSQFSTTYGKQIERVSHETYRMLRRHSWPGNIRELKNVVQTAVLMADGKELTPEFLPRRIQGAAVHSNKQEDSCSFSFGTTLEAVEKELIRMTLARVGGNKKLAASILGISRRSLYNKIQKI